MNLIHWGWVLDYIFVQGTWSPQERVLPIYILELRTICLTLLHWSVQLRGLLVRVWPDNNKVVKAPDVAWARGIQRALPILETSDGDLLASRFNAKLEGILSRTSDPLAFVMDSWMDAQICALPLLQLIPYMLPRIWVDRILKILIALVWSRRTWYSDIVNYSTYRTDLLMQGSIFHASLHWL